MRPARAAGNAHDAVGRHLRRVAVQGRTVSTRFCLHCGDALPADAQLPLGLFFGDPDDA